MIEQRTIRCGQQEEYKKIMTKMKVWCLIIRIKRNDELHGKRLQNLLIDFLMGAKISGAILWNGVDGFGKRRRSAIKLEGISSTCL
jgi:PII-like signaling protein